MDASGRNDANCCSLNPERDSTGLSLEDELIAVQDKADADLAKCKTMQDRLAAVRTVLTETQYRRLWMRYVDELSEVEIAALENVSQQRISASLRLARRKIINKL